MLYDIVFYETAAGRSPVDEFLDLLQPKARAKVEKWMAKLERDGPDLPRPYADIVSGKIRELRVLFASQHYRFLYFFYGKTIIITGGFIKKTDAVPVQEINRAENCMNDFLNRHQGNDL